MGANHSARIHRFFWFENSRNENNRELLKTLQPGDLIVFGRSGFMNDWGVYIGKYRDHPALVHLNATKDGTMPAGPTCQCEKILPRRLIEDKNKCEQCRLPIVGVLVESYWEVVGNHLAELCPQQWWHYYPYNQMDVVIRALAMVGEADVGKFACNSEHFAKWCRFNKATSAQSFLWWNDPTEYMKRTLRANPQDNLPLIQEVVQELFGREVDMAVVNRCLGITK